MMCVCETRNWNSIDENFFRRTSRLSVVIFMTKTGNQKLKLNWTLKTFFLEDEQVVSLWGCIYDESQKRKIETNLMKTSLKDEQGTKRSWPILSGPGHQRGGKRRYLQWICIFNLIRYKHSINADGDPRSPQPGPCHYFVTLPTPSSPDHLVAMVGNIANSLRGKEI